MTRKSGEKEAARELQAKTGRSYQGCLNLVRSWKAKGLDYWNEIEKVPVAPKETKR